MTLKSRIFCYISLMQLFVASGVCIYFSSRENIHLPDLSNFDKVAHFFAYFVYGLSLQVFFIALFFNKKSSKLKRIILASAVGVMFATSDELHQSFVPGRSCDILDLLVDFCGINLSLICHNLIYKIYKKIHSTLER